MKKIVLSKNWKALLILICISMLSVSVYAQSRPIKGKVTDDKGEPLIGATVRLKNGKGAAATDVNGNFSINAANGDALVFSYIGFVNQEIPVTENTANVTIRMSSDARSLNDVVVVGYGTQRKRDVTGATASISNTQLQEVPASNVVQQLQGRIAGLDITSNSSTPGAVPQIRLRGERSLATSQSTNDAQNGPLFIVDGIPFVGGSLNDINQDDIASIDVLKDASATAIYGSRAAGGVIIITTKRGKSGKTLVNYNGYYGTTRIYSEYPVYNGQEFAALKQQAAIGGNANGSSSYSLIPAEITNLANGVNTDWQKFVFRHGYSTDHELNVSGGSENTQFSVSGGYHEDQGVQYGQDFRRYSLRATIDHQISSRVKFGLNSFQTLSYTDGSGLFPLYNTIALSPLTLPYNADGSVNLLPVAGTLDGSRVNPITITNPYIQNLNRRYNSFNSLYGEVKIIDGLKYRVNVGLTFGQNQGNNYTPISTLYNTSTSISQTNENVGNSENYTYLVENLLTYDKTFAQKHHVTFTGLYSIEKDHSQGTTVYGLGMPADYLQSYNLFQANSVFINSNNQPYFVESGLISYMARVNYAFNEKYLLTATVRTDGSSRLSAGHQYFTYPAFAVGWNIDRENFMKNLTFVNSLKLRAGYGVTADQNVTPYQVLGNLFANAYNYGNGPSSTAGQNGYLVLSLPSTDLKFEHTNNINIGLDFSLFKERITGSVDVYQQRTYDILQTETLPQTNGATSTIVNAGNTKGSGIEISLSTVNLRSQKGLNWSTDFNFSVNRNSIVSLHDNLPYDKANGWFVGQPFNIIYDYKKIGIWQTNEAAQAAVYGEKPGMIKVEDVNHDNKIDASDAQVLGSYQPKFVAGLTNRFSYQGFDLSFVAFARIGQKVAVTYLGADSGGSGFPYFLTSRPNQYKVNYWTPTNPTNDFPQPDASLTGPTYGSTLQYRDGSFIKMRSINFGYTIPTRYTKRAGVSSVHIYATCANPFIIWSPLVHEGLALDPEGNGYGNSVTGVSTAGTGAVGRAITVNINNPPTRTFQIGVNAKF